MSEMDDSAEELDDVEPEVPPAPPANLTNPQSRLWALLGGDAGEATAFASQLGADSLPVLLAATDTDAIDHQMNACSVIAALAEPQRSTTLCELLTKPSLDVRLEAISALEQSADPSGRDLLVNYLRRGQDVELRGRVAMLLARGDDLSLKPAVEAAALTADSVAEHDFTLALARLRDTDALSRMAAGLRSNDPKRLRISIQDYAFLNDPGSLVALLTVLDNQIPVLNLRPAHASNEYWLRACDVAAEVVASSAAANFSFDAYQPRQQRSPEDLLEVRTYLQALSASG